MKCATEKCPDMKMLTQCHYHRGPLVLATCDPTGMLRRSRCVQCFSFQNLLVQYNTCIGAAVSVSTVIMRASAPGCDRFLNHAVLAFFSQPGAITPIPVREHS